MSSQEGDEERAGRLVGSGRDASQEAVMSDVRQPGWCSSPESSKESSGAEGDDQRDRHLAKGVS